MALSPNEAYLLALPLLFGPAYLIWRLGRMEYFAPLVVVQIITGIALGPSALGQWLPELQREVFNPAVLQMLHGLAMWAIMLFLWTVGVELEINEVWHQRRDTFLTAGFALGVPLLAGSATAWALLTSPAWRGSQAEHWQFALGIGMSCAVTALPILMLFLEKLDILQHPIGQRILRYASLDDILIWVVLSVVLLDVQLLRRQLVFLLCFFLFSLLLRRLISTAPNTDRWYLVLIWIPLCSFSADWAGYHYIVGAFLSGLVLEAQWFNPRELALFRKQVMLTLMPAFFLSTGLRTQWSVDGIYVIGTGALLLLVSIYAKLAGVHLSARLLKWKPGEASLIGWLLQTKALIVIIFANVLLDKQIITGSMFAAILLMAVGSTVLAIPRATPALAALEKQL